MTECSHCSVRLTGQNWYPAHRKVGRRICKTCQPHNPFRRPQLRKMFDACVEQAHDNFSEFYYAKTTAGWNMGPCVPRRGAGHRHAFWNGYNGVRNTFITDSLAYAAWRAGQAFRAGA